MRKPGYVRARIATARYDRRLVLYVAADRQLASIEHATRSAVRATVAMSKMEETR